LAEKIRKTRLSKEARNRANAELKKLRAMAPMSAEATVARNYLDVLLGLPWGKKSKLKKDIAEAQRVLDEDHYGLGKVKDRIVEYLAVQARTNKLKGPILCLVGPPWCRQDLARTLDRSGDGTRIRASVLGRRSRRGGDSGPP
jgi:ATP-dependent Lon protease